MRDGATRMSGTGGEHEEVERDGNTRRAIDIHEGEEVDASAFKALVRQAIAVNRSGNAKPLKKAKS